MRWIADPKHGDLINATDTMYPTMLEVLTGEGSESGRITIGNHHSTAYGVVLSGMIGLDGMPALHGSVLSLNAGSYFSFPGTFNIDLVGDSKVALITRYGFRGQVVSGRLEQRGRLSYIDGCSDSMLVYPPRKGDPVLNHLHFPGNILQTQHTHPSIRMGVVMSGEGVSWRGEHGSKEDLRPLMALAKQHGLEYAVAYYNAYRAAVQLRHDVGSNDVIREVAFKVAGKYCACTAISEEEHADLFSGVDMLHHLRAGGVFMLEESELHSFATVPGQTMEIVAYHPDSDWGPTDEDHPMLNRTFINHGQ